mgnify:CR=1 FL=1
MILEAKKIDKFFKKGDEVIHVFKDFDISVKKGDFIAITGPSGSGKSTLLHLIGGLERPNKGSLLFKGKEIYGNQKLLDIYRNKHVGFVFQFHYLLDDFTAQENVLMPLLIRGDIKKVSKHYAENLLKDIGLEHRFDHYPKELSGGEQQRVAIARALSNEPDLLLADEPTGNLDKGNSLGILNLFKILNKKGLTIMVATHDENFAKNADTVLKFEKL